MKSANLGSDASIQMDRGLLSRFNTVFCNLQYQAESSGRSFSGTVREVSLGGLSVYKYEGHGFPRACRNPQDIRNDQVDNFIFAVPLNAPLEVSQLGHSTVIEPGGGAFLATSKPFEAILDEPAGLDCQEFLIQIPGPILRRHVPYMDECCARSIQMKQGAGKIMKSLILSLLDEGSSLSKNQAARYGSAVLDVVVGITPDEQEFAEIRESPRDVAYARVRQRAANFIEQNLSNTRLDANLVAAHCNVSVRYLFAAFEASSSSVGAQIREMRLQRCRTELLNPALAHHSVTQIALRWGFTNSSSFSRSYLARFGKTPSDERNICLSPKN